MKIIPMKKVFTFVPPFKETCADIVTWVRPMTVICKGKEGVVAGGVLLAPNVFITTVAIQGNSTHVWLPDGSETYGKLYPYEDLEKFMSIYILEKEVPWIGLPNWSGEDIEEDSLFFSYVPHGDGKVIGFNPIDVRRSKSCEHNSIHDEIPVDVKNIENTFPVVDEYGYFVGLALGTSCGECVVSNFQLKFSKL